MTDSNAVAATSTSGASRSERNQHDERGGRKPTGQNRNKTNSQNGAPTFRWAHSASSGGARGPGPGLRHVVAAPVARFFMVGHKAPEKDTPTTPGEI